MDTATFLAQHTALLRDWPAEDVFAFFATGVILRETLRKLPEGHIFRKMHGRHVVEWLSLSKEEATNNIAATLAGGKLPPDHFLSQFPVKK